ncbi:MULTISPECIES: AAA family ATPase [Rhizobium]|uniref:ATP-binding protein n=1 Tax=Rhizobium TaxID=379 RepID=UPI00124CFCC2|nr:MULTISPECIES: AAA family ATPase [Rhizobium]KAF5880555.1 AAA family ATPase [Rhizobium sp. PEPV16]NKL04697.1 AAA family ATPase [Rhizobium leguminosarum bv. viciae]NKL83515.1 AAA family ATPase [Rhizobium leguminosarum bv. viciae]NKL90759.1 AAA family ATPase [Rhizobium leguminosarum bv. viciae]
MSRRKVVALAGLSGIGKSTLLEDARRRLVFEHLQASDLIKSERQERQGKPVAHDLLREGNIDDNQTLLLSGFMRHAPKEGLIVLDGHTIIDTPDGLVEISPSIFSAIGVSRFVVLVDDVEKIALRRLSDTRRTRPFRSSEELAEHQERSVLATYRAALALRVPLLIVSLNEHSDIAMFLDE